MEGAWALSGDLFPDESPGTANGPDAEDGEEEEEVFERNYPTPEELRVGEPEPKDA